MARIRRIFRTRLWLYSLLCVLSVVARSEAATRVPVKMPTNAVANSPKGVATKGTGVVHVDVSEGEYIPGATIDKRVPVKTIKRIDYSIPRTITQAKSLLKANLAQALLTATIGAAVAGVGWVMSPENTLAKKKTDYQYSDLSFYYYFSGYPGNKFHTIKEAYDFGLSKFNPSGYKDIKLVYSGSGVFQGIEVAYLSAKNATYGNLYTLPINSVGSCPVAPTINGCPSSQVDTLTPLGPTDYDVLDPYISSQTADWIKSLVRDGCAGALNVEACTQDLQDFHNVTGPASVPGPTTTTTGTYTRPDGTTGTTSSVTTTNYSLLYGDNYFDYSKSTTITNTKDGVPTDQSTTTEDPAVTEETPPEDEKEEEKPSPCTTNCDGPAYVDMYDKTDKTKERELDSYKSKIQSVPIIAAVSGLFNVSVSAACPVWSYSGTLELVGASMPIDLVFDFQCQPWFTDLRPYVQAIMLIVCGLLAVRIGLL